MVCKHYSIKVDMSAGSGLPAAGNIFSRIVSTQRSGMEHVQRKFNSAKKSTHGLTQDRSTFMSCPQPPPLNRENQLLLPFPMSFRSPWLLSRPALTHALLALTRRCSLNVLPSVPPSHTPLLGALSICRHLASLTSLKCYPHPCY